MTNTKDQSDINCFHTDRQADKPTSPQLPVQSPRGQLKTIEKGTWVFSSRDYTGKRQGFHDLLHHCM